MKQKRFTPAPAIGGASLLGVFGVLCLVIFALLSLSTALAEQRLSQTHASQTEQWYTADYHAQEIFARLRAGESVPGIERDGESYRYSLPVSDSQTLQVCLRETDGRWTVLSWRAAAHSEDPENTLPVWRK